MKKLRVLVLMHEDLVPPDSCRGYSAKEILEWKTEYDVLTTLREMGHDAQPLGVRDDLGLIRQKIEEFQPHVAFNLLEEFHGVTLYDQHVVSYLELMRQPYTGCNPRGLLLAHDKPLSKKILSYHRIPNPRFVVFPYGRRVQLPKWLEFPLIVKSVSEEASLAISQASVVRSEEKLKERVEFVHYQCGTDAMAEQYIEGRELYVGVLGNHRLQTFPPWELMIDNLPDDAPRIATRKVKWDPEYQKKHSISTDAAQGLSSEVIRKLDVLSKRIYRTLNLSGYARMDFRLTSDERLFVLEANPNPNLSYGEDFAESAETNGVSYEELLQRIVNLARTYQAAWKK